MSAMGAGPYSTRTQTRTDHTNRGDLNGQQYEMFLTRPVIDGFQGCDKEQLRQTILKHDFFEEAFPVDIDFFEQMTLNLVETKEEQPCYVPPNSDSLKEEATLSKRPRRGQSGRGRGRGRKRMDTCASSTNVAEVCQPQIEQPKCEELQGPEEGNLTCWGKRTRRPPRQR
ncbi:hypothetical protein EV2_024399 [Malus domestica]